MRSKHRDRNSRRGTNPKCVNEKAAANSTNEGDLANDAKNPCSPVNSVYIPPNPPATPGDSVRLERGRRRVFSDVSALLKLDHEVGPLRYQLSEIVGKVRALGLNGSNFDLCRRSDQRLDLSDRSILSSSVFGGLSDLAGTSRPATTSCSLENQFGFVGKMTSRSSTFSVVDKLASGEPRISCLDGSSRPGVLDEPRDGRAPYDTFNRKSLATIERDMFAWKTWSAHNKVHISRPSLLCESERESRIYRGIGNSRLPDSPNGCSPELWGRRSSASSGCCHAQLHRWNTSRTTCRSNYTSESTVVQVINGDCGNLGGEPTNKRSIGHVPVHARNSVATQVTIRGAGHKSTQTERVTEDDGRVSSSSRPINLWCIDRAAGSDRQIPRAASASQIRVVSVNTEYCAIVERKRFTSRAVSPISGSSSSTSDVLLAAVSGVFVQQVRQEVPEVAKSPVTAVVVDEKNNVTSRPGRDSHPRKFDSQLGAEDLSKELRENKEDRVIPLKSTRTQRLHPPAATWKITPAVLTDGSPKSWRALYPNFATSGCIDDESRLRLSHQVVRTRSGRARSPSKGANQTFSRDVLESRTSTCLTEEELSNEKRQEAREVSDSRISRSGDLCAQRKNRGPSATNAVLRVPIRPTQARTSRPTRLGRRAREYRKPTGATVVERALPGMRSSPEDFFCDT
ncbi:uncharacterized protein LOC116840696 [Odontomachus brunneus]|uniref:uncharacterized protein LOC116840696 n=1 Tax=Odontomachus brunneus TaxID=486640 RepID=UPI0013F1BD50|nr:uncharacterized protein LOC116840696 [Odontomachus brunneus]